MRALPRPSETAVAPEHLVSAEVEPPQSRFRPTNALAMIPHIPGIAQASEHLENVDKRDPVRDPSSETDQAREQPEPFDPAKTIQKPQVLHRTLLIQGSEQANTDNRTGLEEAPSQPSNIALYMSSNSNLLEGRNQRQNVSPPEACSQNQDLRSLTYVIIPGSVANSQLGIAMLPTDVKLITKLEDLYQWSILTARKAALFNKQLSKHSTRAYIDLCTRVGVHFKAVLAEGAANYEQEMPLFTTSTAFDAPGKSINAREWSERYNAEFAKREELEIELIRIKSENVELLTEMKALRKEEATRIRELEKAQEVLLITSRILQERALKASEDSQKITHAATSLKLGNNPCM
ncbi:hypothetical protein VE00_05141 [Pseudogymnoascus sp. WSF 3629]|nr:hypothetical protein VE00_05141 [Pseudogymnoascus sp. WSF 3629]